MILKLDTDVAAAKYQYDAHKAAQTAPGVGLVVKVLGYVTRVRARAVWCMYVCVCVCVCVSVRARALCIAVRACACVL